MAKTPSDYLRPLYREPLSTGPIFIVSLPNEQGTLPGAKSIATRDPDLIDSFCRKWDRPGRGLFKCINPLKPGETSRSKDTIGEITCLHSDIDAKDLAAGTSRDDVVRALLSTEFPPTRIVASGHGLHAYWYLREAMDATEQGLREQVETALRQIADVFAGDPSVCEISRLMRLAGTHNSKHGEWVEVEEVLCVETRRYDLDELEEWLSWQSRLLHRREPEKAPAGAAGNPFLAVAEKLGFKAPIDVEARLSAMSYQGSGDASIHATQLAVSASLLNNGTSQEEVVSILLDATRAAAGAAADRWNWRSEERAIRRMCETWLSKNPVKVERLKPKAERATGTDGGTEGPSATVHDLGEKRRKPRAAAGPEQPEHVVLGEGVIQAMRDKGEELLLTRDGLHLYRNGEWSKLDEEGELRLRILMENGARTLGMKSKARLFSECQGWIERNPDLWVDHVPWNRSGKVIFLNGAVDPLTGTLEPHSPALYATYSLQATWTGETSTPMMDRFFEGALAAYEPAERSKLIRLIWEWIGSALVRGKGRALSKAFLALGAQNSGKSTIGHLIAHLYGSKTSATSIRRAAERFGLEEVVKAEAWVVHEASQENRRIDTDDLKAFLSGDDVSMEGKGKAIRTVRKEMPVFWASNNMPAFVESTGAMVDRVIPVRFPHIFEEKHPVGIGLDHAAWRSAGNDGYLHDFLFQTEGAAIAGRALAAWRVLRERGHFDFPPSVMAERKELAQTSNSVAQFVEECVEPSSTMMVRYADVRAAAAAFVREQDGVDAARGMRGRTFWMLFQGAAPGSRQWRSNGLDYRTGVCLNERGLRLFEEEKARSDNQHGLSASRGEVNRIRADPSARDGSSALEGASIRTGGPLF